MARLDYLSDDDGDLLFEDGDLVVGESDEDHIIDIVMLSKGSDREFPALGVDAVRRYLNKPASSRVQFERDVKQELAKDGYTGIQLDFEGEGLEDFTIKT